MVYVHLAEGFEEVEALTVVDLLKRADIDVETVSMTGEKMVRGTHGVNVEADILFADADYDACDMIVLPGGMPGTENLKKCSELCDRIGEFGENGKLVGAICAAPTVLGTVFNMSGKTVTMYPGTEKDAGYVVPVPVDNVHDGNVITAMGPAMATDFALEIIESLKDRDTADRVAREFCYDRM